ncbi:hypothetical protein [Streptomyces hokutonensis]|uniref:Uncharacterized protein n=1 Tax=Streptomyces hokutonensis TaxID=1306990 RepID=A0ABW6M5G4_9ACTN
MPLTPQQLEQIYAEKVALAPGREAAVTRLAYAATVLDNYAGTTAADANSASWHLRTAQAKLTYLDRVRQGSTHVDATSDPEYRKLNSSEQASQVTVLAQTDIAIRKATEFRHEDTANALVGLRDSFEAYSMQVREICAREDGDSPFASSTASPTSTEAHPTEQPPSAGPAAPGVAAGATPTAASFEVVGQAQSHRLRGGELDAAWDWAGESMNMFRENYMDYGNPPDATVVNLFREERGETAWESSTAIPINPEARRTDATDAARSYKLTDQNTLENRGRLRKRERDAAWGWAEEYKGLVRANDQYDPQHKKVVNLFRAERGEIPWPGEYPKTPFSRAVQQEAQEATHDAQPQQDSVGFQLAKMEDYSLATFEEWRASKFPQWTPESSRAELREMKYPFREPEKGYRIDVDASRARNAEIVANAPRTPQHPQNPVGQHAYQALPQPGNRQGPTQADPATQPPTRNPYQNPHRQHGPAR